jgi:PAS domain S-box-containing protein
MAGYVLLKDANGIPLLMTRVDSYRTAFLQGKESMFYTSISFVVIGGIIFAATALLMERLVLSRISTLNATVVKLGETDDHSTRVVFHGNDELSNLAKNINGMLDVIQKSREELRGHAETLEKRVEERTKELNANQERLNSILSASPDAIIAIDLQGDIVECNEQMTKLCGSNRSDLVGKSAPSFVAVNDQQRVINQFVKTAAESEDIARLECTLIKKDNTEYPAELSLSVVRDAQGTPIGFVSIIRDLTERKQIEQRLFKSERLAAIGELAGMIGHDLRNPLTGIKNAVYFVKKKDLRYSDSKGKPMFEVIDNCVEHSNKITNDLVEYSREIRLDISNCTPKSLLADALIIVKVPSHIQLIDNTSSEPAMKADVDKIKRVFINIIKNAIEAMPRKGKLEIESTHSGTNVDITFADTGTGIPEETMKKIFMPLVTTKAQGMGFGLAICKRIVDAHGGKISIKSVVGVGTKFTVTLPVEPEAESRAWQ